MTVKGMATGIDGNVTLSLPTRPHGMMAGPGATCAVVKGRDTGELVRCPWDSRFYF